MMHSPKKIFFENLDGLRFLCFLSVFFFHSFATTFEHIFYSPTYTFVRKQIFGNGNLGVNFFFVLSGFLITYLLIEEKKMNSSIDIKKFWMRRILRIWPLYFVCVLIGFVFFPLMKGYMGMESTETATPLYYLTFISNFELLNKGLPDASILGVLWSIAVEEQFYFFWPLILSVFPVKKYWIPFSIIMIVHFVFRGLYNTNLMHEYHSLSCMGDLTVGSIGAWLIQTTSFKKLIENISRWTIALLYFTFILIFFFRDEMIYHAPFVRIFERSCIAVVILLIIIEQTYCKNSLFKMSRFKIISKLGKVSYGLYCLHFIGILSTIFITRRFNLNTQLWQVLFLEPLIGLNITICLSLISYRFFERPFLKLKDRFAYIAR